VTERVSCGAPGVIVANSIGDGILPGGKWHPRDHSIFYYNLRKDVSSIDSAGPVPFVYLSRGVLESVGEAEHCLWQQHPKLPYAHGFQAALCFSLCWRNKRSISVLQMPAPHPGGGVFALEEQPGKKSEKAP